jgi:sugar lactone lactonase YvrE
LAILVAPSTPQAHEIPSDVLVQAFVKPEGQRLGLLVRAPLQAMRDIEFPTRGPGYLDLERAEPFLRHAAELWIGGYVLLYEEDRVLAPATISAVRVSLPSDRSFASVEEAFAHVTAEPLPPETDLPWEQAMLDVLFEYEIASDTSDFAINPILSHLGFQTVTVLRFVTPEGNERVLQYTGHPGLVRLDPRWHHAALRFVALGFGHILDGIDHLLFLLCLVVPVRRFRPLIAVVTSFTVAHSITLIASAMGLAPDVLWFPLLIETLIAASIVYMALENIVGAKLHLRWQIAFGFGLVHGFGFSFALSETLQFAGAHLLTSLLAFNVGVELGQLFVLVFMVPALGWLLGRAMDARMGTILLSALLAHTAWHWMTERGSELVAYQIALPPIDALFVAGLMRWTMLLLIVLGVAWLLKGPYERAPCGHGISRVSLTAVPPAKRTPSGEDRMLRADHIGRIVVVLGLLPSSGLTAQMIAPNPYVEVPGVWAELPEGRSWGAVSAIYPTTDGKGIWVAERCGANSCIGSDVDPILLFDLDGNVVRTFGSGMIAWPHGMFVDPEDNLWVTDAVGFNDTPPGQGHTVLKFSPEGELLMTLGEPGVEGDDEYHFSRPTDVLVAPNGDIFVADGHHHPSGNHRIVKYTSEGTYITEWGSLGSNPGQFREPHGLTMDSQGRLFVADRYNNRWTQFSRPSGIFIDGDDVLYAADSESRANRNPGWLRGIYIGDARTGWVTAFLPDPEPDPERGGSGAEGVAVDAMGNIYAADVGTRMIVRKYVKRANR